MINFVEEACKAFKKIIIRYDAKVYDIGGEVLIRAPQFLLWAAYDREGLTVGKLFRDKEGDLKEFPLSLVVAELIMRSDYKTIVSDEFDLKSVDGRVLAELNSWGQWLDHFDRELLFHDEIFQAENRAVKVIEPRLRKIENIEDCDAVRHELFVQNENRIATGISIKAGHPCPQDGWWSTPAKIDSRRHFMVGEIMPEFHSDYGDTFWQWDANQKNIDFGNY